MEIFGPAQEDVTNIVNHQRKDHLGQKLSVFEQVEDGINIKILIFCFLFEIGIIKSSKFLSLLYS